MKRQTATLTEEVAVSPKTIEAIFPNVRIEEGTVLFSEVLIDDSIQRGKQPGEINAIAGDFNPVALGVVHVSVRPNADKALIDGQQRMNGAVAAGWNEPVRCLYYFGMTRQQEAILFRQLNFRRSVSAMDLFKAAVTEGDERAVAISDLLARYEVKVQSGGFAAIKTALRICSWPAGLRSFAWAFDLVAQTWGTNSDNMDGKVIEALSMLHYRYGDLIDPDALRKKLTSHRGGLNGIIGDGRTLQTMRKGRLPVAIVEVIIGIYNQHIRKEENKLPEWQRSGKN